MAIKGLLSLHYLHESLGSKSHGRTSACQGQRMLSSWKKEHAACWCAGFFTAFCYFSACVILQVQEGMLNATYSDDILCLPDCGIVMDDQFQYLWRGPRVRMGMWDAVPHRVVPHGSSGRADYYGGLKNRYVSCWADVLDAEAAGSS